MKTYKHDGKGLNEQPPLWHYSPSISSRVCIWNGKCYVFYKNFEELSKQEERQVLIDNGMSDYKCNICGTSCNQDCKDHYETGSCANCLASLN